jgi:hypothetical protein
MPQASFPSGRVQAILLIAILTVGACLRLYGLENQSLWNDELCSWFYSHYDCLSDVIDKGVRPDIHPPGYQTVLYFVERYLGDSEAMLRLPSAIAGILSIAAIFLLGKRLYSPWEGLLAAATMAVMWCPIYYSQEARSYALLLLFALLTSYFWIDLVRRLAKNGRIPYGAAVAYIAAAGMASYLHYYGLFLVALQGCLAVMLVIRNRRALLAVVATYALVLLTFAPWIPSMRLQMAGTAGSWIPAPLPTAFLSLIGSLYDGAGVLVVLGLYECLALVKLYSLIHTEDGVKSDSPPKGEPSGGKACKSSKDKNKTEASAIVAPVVLQKAFPERLLDSPSLLLIAWLVVPFALVYGVSVIGKPILTNRNLIILLPPAYLLMARAVTQLPVHRVAKFAAAIGFVGLFTFNLFFVIHYYEQPTKEPFREAARFVMDHADPHKNTVVLSYLYNQAFLDYYFRRLGAEQRVDLNAGEDVEIPKLTKLLDERKPERIWYIYSDMTRVPPSQNFLAALCQHARTVKRTSFLGVQVLLLE